MKTEIEPERWDLSSNAAPKECRKKGNRKNGSGKKGSRKKGIGKKGKSS
jgi:hypothetical protein